MTQLDLDTLVLGEQPAAGATLRELLVLEIVGGLVSNQTRSRYEIAHEALELANVVLREMARRKAEVMRESMEPIAE